VARIKVPWATEPSREPVELTAWKSLDPGEEAMYIDGAYWAWRSPCAHNLRDHAFERSSSN